MLVHFPRSFKAKSFRISLSILLISEESLKSHEVGVIFQDQSTT